MDERPDPDALLAAMVPAGRGLLKVFLGYAAGVGKTFAMLQAAQAALAQGRDVVAGWIEPHNRPETLFQLAGLEGVKPRVAVHGPLNLSELDLEACLKRRPQVLLVDELAHTNAPGSRHEKRWQDVDELLGAGIEVWTTLNIQHLDSMNDVVGRVTGVVVSETVPDRVFDQAGEVEVVDVDPEDLIDRLKQGKIYEAAQANLALVGFFKKDNLLALRELALRRTADRVAREVDTARTQGRVQEIWPVRERLLVSVGPSPLSEDLLRHAARLARSLGAELLAVYIETPAHRLLSPSAQTQLEKNLAVAEALGAETVVLQGEEIARDLVAYARKRNVTKLVLGKNRNTGRKWGRRTIGDDLLRLSGDIDVYVLSGRNPPQARRSRLAKLAMPWKNLAWSTLIAAGFTGLAILLGSWGMAEANVVLTLLLAVVATASLFGLAEIIYASVLAVLAFNFFFTQPRYSLAVDDPQYYLVFFFLLAVGVIIGTLTQRLRRGILASREREQRMEALNRMHRELARLVDAPGIRVAAAELVGEVLGRRAQVLQPEEGAWSEGFQPQDAALFSWVFDHGQKAGHGTTTLREHRLSVWPLAGTTKVLGVLVLDPPAESSRQALDRDELIESLAASLASALERVELIVASRTQALAMEAERARNALLHSLSHDLRTPLTVIAGTAESMAASAGGRLSAHETSQLGVIADEAHGLSRQVENLLNLSRLTESGVPWSFALVPAEDPAFSAVGRFRALHPGDVALSADGLPLIRAEPHLVEQALLNLLENALVHASGKAMEIEVVHQNNNIEYRVLDRGPGVPEAAREEIFGRFVRGAARTSGSRGTGLGLGLAIVRAVASVHGGSASVSNREGGGAVFVLSLPVESPPEGEPQ